MYQTFFKNEAVNNLYHVKETESSKDEDSELNYLYLLDLRSS